MEEPDLLDFEQQKKGEEAISKMAVLELFCLLTLIAGYRFLLWVDSPYVFHFAGFGSFAFIILILLLPFFRQWRAGKKGWAIAYGIVHLFTWLLLLLAMGFKQQSWSGASTILLLGFIGQALVYAVAPLIEKRYYQSSLDKWILHSATLGWSMTLIGTFLKLDSLPYYDLFYLAGAICCMIGLVMIIGQLIRDWGANKSYFDFVPKTVLFFAIALINAFVN